MGRDETKIRLEQPPSAAGEIISNLYVVYSGGKIFLGRAKLEQPRAGHAVTLSDVLEIFGAPQQTPEGRVAVRILPVPPSPFDRPPTLEIFADVVGKVEDPQVGKMYASMTGISGIAIPSGPLVRR
jgi:hypothetical protein